MDEEVLIYFMDDFVDFFGGLCVVEIVMNVFGLSLLVISVIFLFFCGWCYCCRI